MFDKYIRFTNIFFMENYIFYDNIGQGSFGEVIKAKKASSGKIVAIKKIIVSGDDESIFLLILKVYLILH